MTLAVYLTPNPAQAGGTGGIGRVVQAQYAYLPDYGIELTSDPRLADITASHVTDNGLGQVDVLHLHGMYPTAEPESGNFEDWAFKLNAALINAARSARAITMPSQWAAYPFSREMRVSPVIIPNGVNPGEWHIQPGRGYALWNKNRNTDVCDPTPALKLAESGIQVVSTFAPIGHTRAITTFKVIGQQPHAVMQGLIQAATCYLGVTIEVFSLSVLEALASGVPVLGYDWGGTAEIIEHEKTGYLVKPGDMEGLKAGFNWLTAYRDELAETCQAKAEEYAWPGIIEKYATLYKKVADQKALERHRTSIVITCFNYGEFVADAIKSAQAQEVKADEIIVVNDGSTDNSLEVINTFEGIKVINQTNSGVARARNAGIESTRSEYIICLDADDKLDPKYIKTLLPEFRGNRALGIAYTGLGIIQPNGKTKHSPDWSEEFSFEKQATISDPPKNTIPCAAMFRRSMWERAGGYKQNYHPAEDAEFWLRGTSIGFLAKRVTEMPLFNYRLHDGGAHNKGYKPINAYHPFMKDGLYPMAAPAARQPLVRSYRESPVTVIIPVGPGHIQYLTTAIETLIGQVFRNWRLIVVNDTTKKTDRNFNELPGDFERVMRPFPFAQVLTTSGGVGPGRARNLGLAQVKTPFVMFLDSDDYLVPTALEELLTAIKGKSSYIYSDYYTLEGGEFKPRETLDYTQEIWLRQAIHPVTTLMATECARQIGGFNEELAGYEDWEFYLKAAVMGVCGERLQRGLLVYRLDTGQRRSDAVFNQKKLTDELTKAYQPFLKGEKKVMGCGGCGGGSVSLPAAPENTQAVNRVRLEFVGPQQGAIPFTTPLANTYYAANNDFNRYIDVLPEEANHFLNFGFFKKP